MKQRLLLALAIIFCVSTKSIAQTNEVRFLIDTCIVILKQNSVNVKNVNWKRIKRNALAEASAITDAYKLGPVIRHIYESVNDFHGAFFYKDSTFKISHDSKPISDSIRSEWNKGVRIKTELLENNIGYLRIPYMSTSSAEENNGKAQGLNDSLCSLLKKNINGIILDLRLNGGGDMHLMILGVEQLLGEGQVGSFHVRKKESWTLKNHSFFTDTALNVSIAPKCNINGQSMPIVLLTSTATGSSGEFFIMSFKGRERTIQLGTETAGYVTVFQGIPVNDAAYMYVSVGYGADRNGKIYREAIQPDIPFTAIDKFNDIRNDEKVKAAVNWLKLHFN